MSDDFKDVANLFKKWTYIPSTECMIDICKNAGIRPTQYKIERTKQLMKEQGIPLHKIETRIIKKGNDIIVPIDN